MLLRVHNIQRFCLDDGPGIRTTVFLQGCPLRCWWCQNPAAQPGMHPRATDWPIPDLADVLERDRRFWTPSGGGVTASGGEPLAQAEALAGLLSELGRRCVHRAVDTSGTVPRDDVARVAPHADLWLWDVKAVDPARHHDATGGDASLPLDNLAWLLDATDAAVRVRVPLVGGFNADAASLADIGRWIASLPRRVPVELLPGHDIRSDGASPAPEARRAAVGAEQVARARDVLRASGIEVMEPRR